MHPITQTLSLAYQSLLTFTRITRGYLIFLLVAFTIFGVVTTVQGYILSDNFFALVCGGLWIACFFLSVAFDTEPKNRWWFWGELLGGYVLFLALFIIAVIWLHATGIPLPPHSVAR